MVRPAAMTMRARGSAAFFALLVACWQGCDAPAPGAPVPGPPAAPAVPAVSAAAPVTSSGHGGPGEPPSEPAAAPGAAGTHRHVSTEAIDAAALRSAIERAAAYFAARRVQPDVGWLLGQTRLALGDAFEPWAQGHALTADLAHALRHATRTPSMATSARMWELRSMPLPVPPLQPPAAPARLQRPSIAVSRQDMDAVIDMMHLATACRDWVPQRRAALTALLATDAQGYRLTHQLLSAGFVTALGCMPPGAPEARRAQLAAAVWREQLADGRVDDLAFERMAALCHAGACQWLHAGWVDAILAAQKPSGSWGVLDPIAEAHAFVSEQHTAALALYVLARVWQGHFAEVAPAPKPPTPPKPTPTADGADQAVR